MATKVLMFGWEFPPHASGGLGVACEALTRALSREGFEIVFVLPKNLGMENPDHVRIRYADPTFGGKTYTINSLAKAYISNKSYKNLKGRLRGENIFGDDLVSEVLRYAALAGKVAEEEEHDVIYAHDWLSFAAGLEAKRISGKPLIAHIHNTIFDRSFGNAGDEEREIEYEGLNQADIIVAVSEHTKRLIVEKYGISSDKVMVVHNGIDDDTFPVHAPRDNRFLKLQKLKDQGYKLVLFFSRITIQKGPDYFIKAAKKVLEHNDKVLFLVAGSGDMERQVIQQAAYLGIGDKVLFIGYVGGSERVDLYRMVDLYVVPSVSEPFGIMPLEAMKVGTPVLISKQSGVSEVAKNMLKADFWDTDELANKILATVGYPALAKTLTGNAQSEVIHITWSKAANKLKEIIHKIVSWFSE
jgi:glycosyltransferase involved in cell wall biosynthesis